MSEPLALYLRLTPEFGGTRFGPFEQHEVCLGSSRDNNHIVLPENLGVAPSHVKVYRQDDMGIIIAPVERTASVFVWQGRATRPKQINTNVAVRAGDSFALVTAQGPRFVVEIDELPKEVQEKRERMRKLPAGARRLSAKAFKEEGKRQAWVAVLTTGPGQIAQRAYTFVVSGAIFMPRNILMILGIGAGYIFGGVTMCSNFSLKDKVLGEQKKVENLTKQNEQLNDLANKPISDFRYEDLAQRITGSVALAAALKDDTPLLGMIKTKASAVFKNPGPYDWLIDPNSKRGRSTQFANLRKAIADNDDIDGDTARLLPFVAAIGDLSTEGYALRTDSEGADVCTFGPLGLTYRQARNFGLNVALDAFIPGSTAQYEGEGSGPARRELFKVTADAARMSPEQLEAATDGESTIWPVGKENCLHMNLDDDRANISKVASALARHLGPKGAGLPSTDENASSLSRLSKFYVADWARADFSDRNNPGFDLASAVPSVALGESGARGAWVLENTASTIARAMVLPCIAVLEHAQAQKELQLVFGDPLPSPIDCLVLKWKLDNEGA